MKITHFCNQNSILKGKGGIAEKPLNIYHLLITHKKTQNIKSFKANYISHKQNISMFLDTVGNLHQ